MKLGRGEAELVTRAAAASAGGREVRRGRSVVAERAVGAVGTMVLMAWGLGPSLLQKGEPDRAERGRDRERQRGRRSRERRLVLNREKLGP